MNKKQSFQSSLTSSPWAEVESTLRIQEWGWETGNCVRSLFNTFNVLRLHNFQTVHHINRYVLIVAIKFRQRFRNCIMIPLK